MSSTAAENLDINNNASTDDAETYARLLPELSRAAGQCAHLMGKWPAGDEHEFHSAFRGFTAFTRSQQKVHSELNSLISACYRDQSAVNRPFEAVDALFENVDTLLDSVRGVRLAADQQEEIRIGVVGSKDMRQQNGDEAASKATNGSSMTAAMFSRPQDFFLVKPDNFATHFRPFVATASSGESADPSSPPHRKYSADYITHPLGDDITNFAWLPAHMAPPQRETVFLPLDAVTAVYIDEPEQLAELVLTLSAATEIAVDVEHHHEHSYLGFTCLLQISTRTADFIVDTLALRDEMWRLAPVFHDPKIVKVLHWAESDVRWLQRDFGLFLVNVFDTAIALQTLRMPKSLAFLVDHVCQIKLNKQHQMSDWRTRPLSSSQLRYAQEDTHYLLYCYDRLRAMLAAADTRGAGANLLLHVLQESKDTAAQLYKKLLFDEDTTWREQLGRSVAGLYGHQLSAIRGLFNWREVRARTVDTNPETILSNGQLLSIGCRLPATAAEVLRMANPATAEVRKSVKELLSIIEEARKKQAAATSGGATNAATSKKSAASSSTAAAAGSNDAKSSSSSKKKSDASAIAISVHIPMTGTLPSVVGQAQLLENAGSSSSSFSAPSLSSSLPASAAAASAAAASSPIPSWMACFSNLPFSDIASKIAVPFVAIPREPQRRQRQEGVNDDEEQKKKKSESAVDDDDDGKQKNKKAAAVQDAVVDEQEQQQQEEEEEDEGEEGKDKPMQIKSLADEHGGLGRKTRKHQAKLKK